MDLSIIIPTYNEGENIRELLNGVKAVVSQLTGNYEIIIVDAGSEDKTEHYALAEGTVFCRQALPGYGNALKEGFCLSKGRYVITMDADFSHEAVYIRNLWDNRNNAELVVASRYINGGRADMPWFRKALSIFLNNVYAWILSLPYKDLSSGFRLYNGDVLKEISLVDTGFSMLQELLTKIHCKGYRILEVPFYYKPRRYGSSHVRLLRMAFSYLGTLAGMWRLRNSLVSADYDEQAYNSRIIPQRLWQRKRVSIIMQMIGKDQGEGILDIGCGTSRLIQSMPEAVGIDINHKVLRYLGKNRGLLVEAGIRNLPFKDNTFRTIICSEVIEHIPRQEFRLDEVERVLVRDGIFILGTPDYSRKWWCFVEWVYKKILPGGYGVQHITHYTSRELVRMFNNRGWKVLGKRYVLGGEVIFKLKYCSKN